MIQRSSIERLKNKIQIDLLFKKGKSLKSGVLSFHFIVNAQDVKSPCIGVGVSKRFVHLAYNRNRIKRQIRAEILKQKEVFLEILPPGLYMILYKGKVSVTSETLSKDLKGLLERF